MAAEPVSKLSIAQHKELFDRLAPSWDGSLSQETLSRVRHIVAELAIKPASEVLDAGSGTGVLLPFLTKAVGSDGRIIEMDISARMLAAARSKGFGYVTHYIQADIACMPLVDKVFDLVICLNAFPHCRHKLKALIEMARVLKKDGRLAICHTMSREAVNNLHHNIGGVMGNDLLPDNSELSQLLTQAGLEIIRFEDKPEFYLVVTRRMS
jgi:ubiquinone/menaquinone biosynthesis C-methylase UbiE